MTLTFCVTHRYSKRTLCPEVIVHVPFIKPSRKSSLCLGCPYFLRSPQHETVPMRRFLLLSPIIPLYPPYVRLPVLTTISSTPQIASNVLSLRSLWLLSDALLAWGTSLSELRSRPLMTVPSLQSSTECLGALLDVLPVRNISWSHTPSRVTPLVPTTRSGATLPVLLLT